MCIRDRGYDAGYDDVGDLHRGAALFAYLAIDRFLTIPTGREDQSGAARRDTREGGRGTPRSVSGDSRPRLPPLPANNGFAAGKPVRSHARRRKSRTGYTITVSYTHLDVYKRQGYDSLVCNCMNTYGYFLRSRLGYHPKVNFESWRLTYIDAN